MKILSIAKRVGAVALSVATGVVAAEVTKVGVEETINDGVKVKEVIKPTHVTLTERKGPFGLFKKKKTVVVNPFTGSVKEVR